MHALTQIVQTILNGLRKNVHLFGYCICVWFYGKELRQNIVSILTGLIKNMVLLLLCPFGLCLSSFFLEVSFFFTWREGRFSVAWRTGNKNKNWNALFVVNSFKQRWHVGINFPSELQGRLASVSAG